MLSQKRTQSRILKSPTIRSAAAGSTRWPFCELQTHESHDRTALRRGRFDGAACHFHRGDQSFATACRRSSRGRSRRRSDFCMSARRSPHCTAAVPAAQQAAPRRARTATVGYGVRATREPPGRQGGFARRNPAGRRDAGPRRRPRSRSRPAPLPASPARPAAGLTLYTNWPERNARPAVRRGRPVPTRRSAGAPCPRARVPGDSSAARPPGRGIRGASAPHSAGLGGPPVKTAAGRASVPPPLSLYWAGRLAGYGDKWPS